MLKTGTTIRFLTVVCVGTVAALGAGVIAISPARAGKSDDAWAQCLWSKVPTSTSNWLAMPAPKRNYGLSDPPREYVLQYRLQAACYAALTGSGKSRPASFNAGAVRKSLLKTRPATIGADVVDPRAFRCTRYFLNDTDRKNPGGSDWGFGEDTSQAQFFSVVYSFAAQGGGVVGLPNEGGQRVCAYIQPDGSFQAAA